MLDREDVSAVIMFADISGSSRIYEVMGARKAHKLITGIVSLLCKVVTSHGGKVAKVIDDEMMCIFSHADKAIAAAFGMQQSFMPCPLAFPGSMPEPGLRIGLHGGRMNVHGEDMYGNSVDMAAWMVSLAGPGQIIATDRAVEMLSRAPCMEFICVEKTVIRSREDAIRVYELIPASVIGDVRLAVVMDEECLCFTWHNRDIILGRKKPLAVPAGNQEGGMFVDDAGRPVRLSWKES